MRHFFLHGKARLRWPLDTWSLFFEIMKTRLYLDGRSPNDICMISVASNKRRCRYSKMLGFLPEMLRTCGSKMNYQNLHFTSQLQMLRSLMISIYSQKQKSRNYQQIEPHDFADRLVRSTGISDISLKSISGRELDPRTTDLEHHHREDGRRKTGENVCSR